MLCPEHQTELRHCEDLTTKPATSYQHCPLCTLPLRLPGDAMALVRQLVALKDDPKALRLALAKVSEALINLSTARTR
jgi:hypothetical protein